MKKLWKNIATRVWLIVSIILVILLSVVTILSASVHDFYELINMVTSSGPRAKFAEGIEPIYVSEYSSKSAVYKAARDMNLEICEEGMVLLKNKNNALPISTDGAKPKISVFGKNSVNIAYGGSGSGGSNDSNAVDLYTGLSEAGFEYNKTLFDFYKSSKSGAERKGNSKDLDSGDTVILSTAETPQSMYTNEVKNSYSVYNDAAIVVLTRIGGEGFDIPRLMSGAEGARNADDHFLQLDANEEDLLVAVTNAGFKKVVLVVNSGNALELGFLESKTGYVTSKGYKIDPDKIDAAIWMGFPGETGTIALGEILNGTVNPSGRLADTYAVDFTKDPTWNNFGDNRITAKKGIPGGDQYVFDVPDNDQPDVPYYFVQYEESVYVGYKYYETRGAIDGDEWYDKAVVYPFGHGLSYTSFEWTLEDDSAVRNLPIGKDATYKIKVKVTNTGSVAGKEVVQLYGHAPYTGKVEKPEVVLLDFAKTGTIKPGKSETVTLVFDPYYLASYDFSDANGNGKATFELDKGDDYALYLSRNAHVKEFMVPFKVGEDIVFDKDNVSGSTVKNRYTDCADARFNSLAENMTQMSRSDFDGTFPTVPTADNRKADGKLLGWLADKSHNNPTNFKSVDMPFSDEDNGLKLRDLLFDDNGDYINEDEDGIPHSNYDDERWELLLDQASVSDLRKVYNYASYHIEAITSIGLPRVNCADGPVGWACFMDKARFYDTCSYCSQTLVATTYSKDVARRFGETVGEEGIIGNAKGDGLPYSGWYAPGVNIHRSPFGGRNFEYYSEDGVLSGKMAAEQIKGCNSRGVFTFVKHFAVNEQETHRSISGDSSWLSEQAMREIYLRPFEIAVKEGGSRAIMSSFNRIGTRWTGGDYRLLTEILRDEWGFKGVVLCDFNTIPTYMNSRQMAYAGGDLNLATQPVNWCDESSAADVTVLRQNIKNALYAVVNSNAMNGEVIGYGMPIWQIILITVDCIVAVGLGVWGYFVIGKLIKGDNTIGQENTGILPDDSEQ